jgi:hypothetical protein
MVNSSLALDDEVIAQVGLGVSKYLEQCLSTEIDVLDKEKFEAIPEFTKSDLTISRHLGRGVYSDVFEVGVMWSYQCLSSLIYLCMVHSGQLSSPFL